MAPMMACRTAPIPLTIAMRQAPMVRKMDSICRVLLVLDIAKSVDKRTYARYDGTHFEFVALSDLL